MTVEGFLDVWECLECASDIAEAFSDEQLTNTWQQQRHSHSSSINEQQSTPG